MRLVDIILSLVLLILFSIPMLCLALLIKITSRGPIIHWSDRVGVNNKIFKMPKFRSMRIDTPQLPTHLLKGESYLTPIGEFLRKTSLDELPQLFSVLIGSMAFVGPRPALFNQDDLIELRTNKNIHLIRPGITGWAQINGRDELSSEEKANYDLEYLKKRSLLFDLKILVLTVVKVIMRKDVSH